MEKNSLSVSRSEQNVKLGWNRDLQLFSRKLLACFFSWKTDCSFDNFCSPQVLTVKPVSPAGATLVTINTCSKEMTEKGNLCRLVQYLKTVLSIFYILNKLLMVRLSSPAIISIRSFSVTSVPNHTMLRRWKLLVDTTLTTSSSDSNLRKILPNKIYLTNINEKIQIQISYTT